MFSFFKRKQDSTNTSLPSALEVNHAQTSSAENREVLTLSLAIRGQRGTGKTTLSNILRGFEFTTTYLPTQQLLTHTCDFTPPSLLFFDFDIHFFVIEDKFHEKLTLKV